jgi:hypothetical protein
MSLTDSIDSYYQFVKARIATKNSARVVAGLLDAQDWPNKNVKFDAFYLLDVTDTPVGKDFYSTYIPVLFRQVQWVWINKGTDLTQGIRKANRGDRFRFGLEAMKGELLYASTPGYTQKFTWAVDANDNWISTPENPPEAIWWKPLEFHAKNDKASGVIYGAAATRIVDMTDAIVS